MAIDVQWPLSACVFLETVAGAVDGRRGGVDQGYPGHAAILEDLRRITVVVLHHVVAVPFGGDRAGALMVDAPRHESDAVPKPLEELTLVPAVGDLAVREIVELAAVDRFVHGQDVAFAGPIESAHQVAANEPGGSGDDDHGIRSRRRECIGYRSTDRRPCRWLRSADRPSGANSTDRRPAAGNAAATARQLPEPAAWALACFSVSSTLPARIRTASPRIARSVNYSYRCRKTTGIPDRPVC